MVQIKLQNGEISISSDKVIRNEEDLLKELNGVLCFAITIYKRRIEKLRQRKISEVDEAIFNQKIINSIVMIPLDEIRENINESES